MKKEENIKGKNTNGILEFFQLFNYILSTIYKLNRI